MPALGRFLPVVSGGNRPKADIDPSKLRFRSAQAFLEVGHHVLNRIFDHGVVIFGLRVVLALRGGDFACGADIDVLGALNLNRIVRRSQLQNAKDRQIELVKITSDSVNGASVGHGMSICYVSISDCSHSALQVGASIPTCHSVDAGEYPQYTKHALRSFLR